MASVIVEELRRRRFEQDWGEPWLRFYIYTYVYIYICEPNKSESVEMKRDKFKYHHNGTNKYQRNSFTFVYNTYLLIVSRPAALVRAHVQKADLLVADTF